MFGWLLPTTKAPHPEDPQKLAEFRGVVSDIKWDHADNLDSLTKVFKAVDMLAEAEIQYYFRRRQITCRWSNALRFGGWILGTTGILLPLLAATQLPSAGATQTPFAWVAPWGYFFLAAAGALFGANALFGATTGHVRFASTQLLLEKIMTVSRISWSEYLSEATQASITEPMKVGFGLINGYAQAVYSATLSETGNWSETVIAELNKYANELVGQKRAPAGVKKPKPHR